MHYIIVIGLLVEFYMVHSPRFSIIIPAYNAQRFLAATIQSILAQSLEDWQCIIIDDGSTDSTVSIAGQFADSDPRVQTFSQPNRGVACARNLGIEKSDSHSQYLAFLDADDIYKPNALETLAAAIESHPGSAGSHGLPDTIDQYNDACIGEILQHV